MTELSEQSLTLSGSELSGLMQSVLAKGASFRFRAKGLSMSPFIRDQDVITIIKADERKIRIGVVAVVVNPQNGLVIVHRIVARSGNTVTIKGDNCSGTDGNFSLSSVVGIVNRVERGGVTVRSGGRAVGAIIAFTSVTGWLNKYILPFLVRIKRSFH